jgi:hypothetical protein
MTTQQLSIHNNRLISINTDKVYSNGTSNMLKTLDGKYISRKVINNKDNTLEWRHIFSLLPEELIQIICEDIYRHKWTSICPQIPIHTKHVLKTDANLQFTCKAITNKGKVCGCSTYDGVKCDHLRVFIPSIMRRSSGRRYSGETAPSNNKIMICEKHRRVWHKDRIEFVNEYIRKHGYSIRNGYPVKINKGKLDNYCVEGTRYYCGE